MRKRTASHPPAKLPIIIDTESRIGKKGVEMTLEQARQLYLEDNKRAVLEEKGDTPTTKRKRPVQGRVHLILDTFDPEIHTREAELPYEIAEKFLRKPRSRVKKVVDDR